MKTSDELKAEIAKLSRELAERQLQTIRGQIEIPEPEHYCKKCRRSFFPSDATARS